MGKIFLIQTEEFSHKSLLHSQRLLHNFSPKLRISENGSLRSTESDDFQEISLIHSVVKFSS